MVNRDDVQLTAEELHVDHDIDAGAYVSVDDMANEKKRLKDMVRSSKQKKRISIRLYESDLDALKRKAQELGLPYQTLINSVLHQYVRQSSV